MLLDICLGNKSAWRVLMLYGETPGAGFTRQDLKKYTNLGNKALSFTLKRLVIFNILTKNKEIFSRTIYKLNKENKYSKDIINLIQNERENLNYLPYSFSIIAREFSREVIDSTNALNIYLFGSVAKGNYREDSDIDFAIKLNEKKPEEDMIITTITDKLSEKFGRKIQCFILTKKQFENKKTKIVEEILKHGIKLA